MSSVAVLRGVRPRVLRPTQSRSLHSTAPARSGGAGDNWHLPFWMPGPNSSKAAFATKMGVFLATGFSLPFVASWWQLTKAK